MAQQSEAGNAIAQSFLEICQELACQPLQPLLQCLREQSPVAKVSSIQDREQLYAVTTILPFANLQELDVSGLQLDAEQWGALLEAVSRCSGLKVLSIKGCNIGALGADGEERVARQLGTCTMSVLDASQNQLGDSFLSTLSRSTLLREADVLTVLDLSENDIGDNGAAALAATLAAAGLQCPMKQLDLSFNRLGDSAARALGTLMATVPLLALELEGNQISDIGGLAVGDALKQTLCLQRLNLNHNMLSSSTLSSIADAVSVNPGSLQELAVAGTSGSEGGVAALLLAACKSKQLHLLDVRGLQLDGQAVEALCQLLNSSCPLVTLRVDVASREAAEAIAQALPSQHSLMHFMLGGNAPEHVLSYIAAAVSANTVGKVQAAGRSSNSPASTYTRHQQLSRTPTQRLAGQQQTLQPTPGSTPPAAIRGVGSTTSTSAQRAYSSSNPRPPPRSVSPAFSQRSAGSSTGNITPPRGLLFASPGSGRASQAAAAAASPGSGGRGNVRTLSMQARRASVIDPQGLAGLAGGGAANKAAEVFKRHDTDGSGYLDAEEMMSALQELGMLEGMRPRQLGKFLSDAIREADTDGDGRVGIEEFTKYYERLARHYAEASRQGRISARRRSPQVPLDAPSDEGLKRVFRNYCRLPIGQGRQVGGSVQQLNAAQFNQLCRDAGLVEPAGLLSQCAVDIIFTRHKPPGSRRLPFKHFLTAMAAVADEAGVVFESITDALSSVDPTCGRPDLQQGACDPANSLSRRHSLGGACYTQTRLSISDLTDTRVGPVLPGRSSAAGAALSAGLTPSCDRGLGQVRPRSATAMLEGATSGGVGVGAALETSHGTAAGSPAAAWEPSTGAQSWTLGSGTVTPPESARGALSTHTVTPQGIYEQRDRQPQAAAAQQEREQQRKGVAGQGREAEAGAAVQQAEAQRRPQQLQQQQPSRVVLPAHDAVHNPLFEGDSEGGAGPGAGSSISTRLLALEAKIMQRVSAASGGGAPSTIAGAAPAGGLERRVADLESAVDETRTQLSAVLTQQEELKGLLGRLLDAGGLASAREAHRHIKDLQHKVEGLSGTVAGLQQAQVLGGSTAGLEEKLAQLTASTDKRHTRVETAIYQVAHQVDLLDSRCKQEQQSILSTLQALLTANSSSTPAAAAATAPSHGHDA